MCDEKYMLTNNNKKKVNTTKKNPQDIEKKKNIQKAAKLGLRKHEQSHHHDTRTRTFITSRLTCKLGLREDKRPVSVLMFSEPCTRLLLST